MELSGNAPFLVLSDANVDDVVAGAMLAKMRNGGAACKAANRKCCSVLIHEKTGDHIYGHTKGARFLGEPL
jgi:succinate-semialdehyde dehydrogenase/glutarate-semialdehyde dehydrogenase